MTPPACRLAGRESAPVQRRPAHPVLARQRDQRQLPPRADLGRALLHVEHERLHVRPDGAGRGPLGQPEARLVRDPRRDQRRARGVLRRALGRRQRLVQRRIRRASSCASSTSTLAPRRERSVEATRAASSVSVGEVQSRSHAEGESEDHFESASRVFANPNRCHAVTFYFYQINKTQTVRLRLEAIRRRVIDPAGDTRIANNPFAARGEVSVIPSAVLATDKQRLEVEQIGRASVALPRPAPSRPATRCSRPGWRPTASRSPSPPSRSPPRSAPRRSRPWMPTSPRPA